MKIEVNDQVLITNEDGHKLDSVCLGPFKVITLLDKNVKLIDEKNNKVIDVHKNRVKKYIKQDAMQS